MGGLNLRIAVVRAFILWVLPYFDAAEADIKTGCRLFPCHHMAIILLVIAVVVCRTDDFEGDATEVLTEPLATLILVVEDDLMEA